jgi:hypothetical protein
MSFAATQIEGSFVASSTLMFLWPVTIWDEDTQSFVPMTFEQKVESRQNIVRFSVERETYEALFVEAAQALDEKYTKKLIGLEEEYRNLQCFALCDPDDFFCDPQDSSVLFQDTWKPTEDPEELVLIEVCQANERERLEVDAEKQLEAEQTVYPLRDKAGRAAINLLEAVGDRNFFDKLSGFELKYGPLKSCFLDSTSECLQAQEGEFGVLVRVLFSGGNFSNAEGDGVLGEVKNLYFDIENGFLTFQIPAIDFANDSKIYGEITFDLELTPTVELVAKDCPTDKDEEICTPQTQTSLAVEGDVQVLDFATGETRIGRFSSSGLVQPFELH